MLYKEIIAVRCQIQTKHTNTQCGAERRIKYKRPSPYRAVNTLRLGYKNQSVNAVKGNNRCLFSDPHKTHKCTMRAERRIIYKDPVRTAR